MGTNKFLNGEGEVDLTELINEINSLSNEVEGKLDKDGSDGGMTGNLEINDNAIGRSTDELLRKIQAAKFVREHGDQVCPMNWKPGKETLKPGLDLVGKI